MRVPCWLKLRRHDWRYFMVGLRRHRICNSCYRCESGPGWWKVTPTREIADAILTEMLTDE